MPHRKPLGSLCHTRADWRGAHPSLLDFLFTPAGTWYRIVGIEETRSRRKLNLTLERIARPSIRDLDEHHAFTFARRPRG